MSQIKANDKLYIIIRSDLKSGAKLAQACHCAFQFAKEHPEVTSNWMNISNYICILESENEANLLELLSKANNEGIKTSYFLEEDFGNSLTAIALEPGNKSKKLCQKLPLAK